jgi:ArsR family transcriptional regulator, arsenate/arsenite/antimonite-responsive transcriptional repressor
LAHSYARSIPRAWTAVSKVFVALGDDHRQRILLMFEKNERLNVSEIAAASALSRPAISYHLKILREAGVLLSEKRGREVYFWVNRARLESALRAVTDYVRENA